MFKNNRADSGLFESKKKSSKCKLVKFRVEITITIFTKYNNRKNSKNKQTHKIPNTYIYLKRVQTR